MRTMWIYLVMNTEIKNTVSFTVAPSETVPNLTKMQDYGLKLYNTNKEMKELNKWKWPLCL